MLYELLTGTVPFEGESVVAIALRHLSEPPRPPSSLVPSISPALDAIVLRALAKRPRAALRRRRRVPRRARRTSARGSAATPARTPPRWRRSSCPPPPSRRHRGALPRDLRDAGDRADHRAARARRRGVVGSRGTGHRSRPASVVLPPGPAARASAGRSGRGRCSACWSLAAAAVAIVAAARPSPHADAAAAAATTVPSVVGRARRSADARIWRRRLRRR